MTQEEKLQLAKEWYNDPSTTKEIKVHLKELFPEFKESEDGRMIKSLKRLIKAYYNVNFPTPEGFEREDMLAWLEKQTIDISSFPEEQRKYMEKYVNLDKTTLVKLLAERDENIDESLKASTCNECEHPTLNCGNFPCDKVKPKFKVGDTIVEKDLDECGCGTIVNIKDGKYIFDDGCFICIKEQERWQLINKSKPKFNVGDWVVYKETGITYQVKEIVKLNCGYAYNLTDGGYISSFKSDDYHLWAIEDAKDGDALVNGSNIFIFHCIDTTRLMGYCHVNTDDGRFYDDIGKNECFCLIDAVVIPATKEQRDLLFQKIKEAGYVWDAEKKELKDIKEQNPTEDNCKISDWDIKVDTIEYNNGYECGKQRVLKYPEDYGLCKKPAWSEEDEKILHVISQCVYDNVANIGTVNKVGCIDWLKSLKERVKGNKQ